MLPAVFCRLSNGPGMIKIFEVGTEVISSDGTKGGIKMMEELKDGDVGKAMCFIMSS